jgi:AMIN domain
LNAYSASFSSSCKNKTFREKFKVEILGFYSLLFLLLLTSMANAVDGAKEKKLLFRDYGELAWQLNSGSNDKVIKVKFEGKSVKTAKSFYLPDPERLVLDFPSSEKVFWSDVVDLKTNNFFNKIRVASHPQKIRIVFDLKRDFSNSYNLTKDSDSLVVIIANKELSTKSSQPPTVIPTLNVLKDNIEDRVVRNPTVNPTVALENTKLIPTLKPTLPVTVAPSFTPTVKPTPSLVPTLTPTNTNTLTPIEIKPTPLNLKSPLPEVADGILRLSKIRFDAAEEDETLRGILLSFNKPTDYQIRRKAKDLFIVTVKDANLSDESLALPHFPPNNFFGFVSIRAQQSGKDLLIYIYVEDGIHLMSYPLENDIRLQVVEE